MTRKAEQTAGVEFSFIFGSVLETLSLKFRTCVNETADEENTNCDIVYGIDEGRLSGPA